MTALSSLNIVKKLVSLLPYPQSLENVGSQFKKSSFSNFLTGGKMFVIEMFIFKFLKEHSEY